MSGHWGKHEGNPDQNLENKEHRSVCLPPFHHFKEES